jgi:predicted secreted hydrolase
LALSDITGNRFLHSERLNRSGPGLAGADATRALVWNGNWQAGQNQLRAISDDFALELRLQSTKAPVIHGVNGVSQKATGEGRASHYISETRIGANGSLEYQGRRLSLNGTVWMDHEFFTQQLDSEQTGWDWLSLQLEDKTELMLFRLRRKDGSIDPHSAGTYTDGEGNSRHLSVSDFRLTPSGEWQSPATRARYPLQWRIEVPPLGLDLQATTPLSNQELVSRSPYSPSYWEGAMDFRGTKGGREIAGVGYLEMTGYDKPVTF